MEKEEMKSVCGVLLSARWWNPLYWAYVVLAPAASMAVCALAGALGGALYGFGRGMKSANRKFNELFRTLP